MLSKMKNPPLEHRRISRAEWEGSFPVTATVLTRNSLSSRGRAKNLKHQPTTQPLLLLIHHLPPAIPRPREGSQAILSPSTCRHPSQDHPSFRPPSRSQMRRAGIHPPNFPPPSPHPTPFPHSLKHPFPTPQHTPTVLRTISVMSPIWAYSTSH